MTAPPLSDSPCIQLVSLARRDSAGSAETRASPCWQAFPGSPKNRCVTCSRDRKLSLLRLTWFFPANCRCAHHTRCVHLSPRLVLRRCESRKLSPLRMTLLAAPGSRDKSAVEFASYPGSERVDTGARMWNPDASLSTPGCPGACIIRSLRCSALAIPLIVERSFVTCFRRGRVAIVMRVPARLPQLDAAAQGVARRQPQAAGNRPNPYP